MASVDSTNLRGIRELQLGATAKLDDDADSEPKAVLPSAAEARRDVVGLEEADSETVAPVDVHAPAEPQRKTVLSRDFGEGAAGE